VHTTAVSRPNNRRRRKTTLEALSLNRGAQHLREGNEVASRPELGTLELGSTVLAVSGAVNEGKEARKDGKNLHQFEEWRP
jgi:hypothetical protein